MNRTNRHPSLRKRVILIFLICVLLPTAFLSYLGLKGFEKERQWQQQVVEQNLENTLHLGIKNIESALTDYLHDIYRPIPVQSSFLTPGLLREYESVASDDGVEYFFSFDENHELIYPPGHRKNNSDSGNADIRNELRTEWLEQGEQLELSGQYEHAIERYTEGNRWADSADLQQTYLLRIARSYVNMEAYGRALETYSQILEVPPNLWTDFSIPYPLIACMQMIRIKKQMGRNDGIEALLNCYELLTERFYLFSEAEYDFYLEQMHEQIMNLEPFMEPGDSERLTNFRQRERAVSEYIRLSSFFIQDLLPQIQLSGINEDSPEIRLQSVQTADEEQILAIRTVQNESGITITQVLLLNVDFFRLYLANILNDYNRNESYQITLSAESIQEATIANDILLTEDFPILASLNPDYRAGIVLSGAESVDALYAQNVMIYYGLIITIIVMIAIGLIFLVRDIYREEELAKLKADFISNVSHEIKTPIATVRTLAENLSEGWVDNGSHQKEYYSLISRESERLSHIVENILEFSRGEAKSKKQRMRYIPLEEIINESLTRFRTMTRKKSIIFNAHVAKELPEVYCDPKSIEQAVLNLLDNAVKYSGNEKRVDLTVKIVSGEVVIAVQDNGCGIPKKDQYKIFKKFYRVTPENGQRISGSGIGLSLVQNIVNDHHGRIEVESKVGKGSTFTMYLTVVEKKDEKTDTDY